MASSGRGLDPQIEKVLADLAAAGDGSEPSIEQMRAAHAAEAAELSGPGEPVAEVRDAAAPGPAGPIPLRAFRPHDGQLPVIAYLHGGGWAVGTLDTFDTLLRRLANASGALVVAVDYRLAPEHPFPAGLEDALAAVRWLAGSAGELGGDPARIALVGDSAGGNLATVTARRLRGEVPLRMQALIYPVCDASLSTPSYRECEDGYGLTAAVMRRYWELYLDGADGLDPDASPLRSDDLAGLPPTVVLTAEFDPLRDEGDAYAARLEEARVPVTLLRYEGTVHGFWRWLAVTDVAHRAVVEVGAALRAALA